MNAYARIKEARRPAPRHIAVVASPAAELGDSSDDTDGHARALHESSLLANALGVRYLTVGGLGLPQPSRARTTPALRSLLAFCERAKRDLVASGIRVKTLGDINDLAATARHALEELVAATSSGGGLTLTLAVANPGHSEILQAARTLAALARAGLVLPEEIDELRFRSEMGTDALPAVDLLIYSKGAARLADFLPFETGSAQSVNVPVAWSRFQARDLALAIGLHA